MPYPANLDHHFVVDPTKFDFYAMDCYRHLAEDRLAENLASEIRHGTYALNAPSQVATVTAYGQQRSHQGAEQSVSRTAHRDCLDNPGGCDVLVRPASPALKPVRAQFSNSVARGRTS